MDTHQKLHLKSLKERPETLKKTLEGYKHPYQEMDKFIRCTRCSEGFYGLIHAIGNVECPYCRQVVEVLRCLIVPLFVTFTNVLIIMEGFA